MIALIQVNKPADFNHYREQVPATLEPYGGENSIPRGKAHDSR